MWKIKVSLRNLIFPSGIFLLSVAILFATNKKQLPKSAGILVITGLLVFELFRFGWKYTPFSSRNLVFPTTPVLDYLMVQEKPFRLTGNNVIPMNQMMPYGLETIEGYDAVYPLNIAQFIASLNSENSNADPQGRYGAVSNLQSHLLNLTNTKYTFALKRNKEGVLNPEGTIDNNLDMDRYKVVFEDKTTVVLENTQVLPRAFMVYDWEVVNDRQEILNKLLDKDYPIDKKIILEENVPFSYAGQSTNSVSYLNYGEQSSIIEVDTHGDGFLFVSDIFYPGWKAFVDGKEEKILCADYVFRAVPLEEGKHVVEFIYDPESFRMGKRISLLSALLLSGVVLYEQKRKS